MAAKLPFTKQQQIVLNKELAHIEKFLSECETQEYPDYTNLFEYVLQTKYAILRNTTIRKRIRQLVYQTRPEGLFEKVMMFLIDASKEYYYVKA